MSAYLSGLGFVFGLTFGALACAADVKQEDGVYVSPTKSFAIPFLLPPKANIKEVRLYVSTNQGESWSFVDTAEPDGKGGRLFFRAPCDGVYWFVVQTVNQDGSRTPPDERGLKRQRPYRVRVEQKSKSHDEDKPAEPSQGDIGRRWNLV